MLAWISQYSETLQVLLNALMVVIWVAYLQIFLISFWRQHRTDLLINMGAGVGLKARCFICNLGLEPLYLLDVLVEIRAGDSEYEAVITDRAEMTEEQMRSASEATNQGPLSSGAFLDIGTFGDLLERASPKVGELEPESIQRLQITALAQTSSKSQIVGAKRRYRLHKGDGGIEIIPEQIMARQVRSWWGRRKLRRKMDQRLQAR